MLTFLKHMVPYLPFYTCGMPCLFLCNWTIIFQQKCVTSNCYSNFQSYNECDHGSNSSELHSSTLLSGWLWSSNISRTTYGRCADMYLTIQLKLEALILKYFFVSILSRLPHICQLLRCQIHHKNAEYFHVH